MKRTHRFRWIVVCSFLMLVAALGYAAQSAATPGATAHPEAEPAPATPLIGAVRGRMARALTGSQSGSLLAMSGGVSFVAPAEFYARSRGAASPPAAAEPNADSSTRATPCTMGAACGAADTTMGAATEASAPDDARDDGRVGRHLNLAAVGIVASGAFIAANEIDWSSSSENLSPAHWFIAAGHFGDTVDVGLGFHRPWAAPRGSPPSPWHPEPCYTTDTCAFGPTAGSPGNGNQGHDPPTNGSPNDPENGEQSPPNNPGNDDSYNGGSTHGDPNKPPVIATTTTPEPSTVVLLATGLGLVALFHVRRRRVPIKAR